MSFFFFFFFFCFWLNLTFEFQLSMKNKNDMLSYLVITIGHINGHMLILGKSTELSKAMQKAQAWIAVRLVK